MIFNFHWPNLKLFWPLSSDQWVFVKTVYSKEKKKIWWFFIPCSNRNYIYVYQLFRNFRNFLKICMVDIVKFYNNSMGSTILRENTFTFYVHICYLKWTFVLKQTFIKLKCFSFRTSLCLIYFFRCGIAYFRKKIYFFIKYLFVFFCQSL
jgi:hypothetical protein